MATTTTNLGLTKPAYSDTADIADINGNMDIIDQAIAGTDNAIAIMANNNTHTAITSGQYVYVRGHGTLADGLYQATANIAQNGTLSASNMTAIPGGGLNALNVKFPNIKIESEVTATASTPAAITLPKSGGILLFRVPRTAVISSNYMAFYTVQNGYVNYSFVGTQPSELTITTSGAAITVSTTFAYGCGIRVLGFE